MNIVSRGSTCEGVQVNRSHWNLIPGHSKPVSLIIAYIYISIYLYIYIYIYIYIYMYIFMVDYIILYFSTSLILMEFPYV